MYAPARGMVGYHGEFLTDTRGSGVMNRLFHSWAPWKGEIPGRRNGALISNDKGQSTAFALWNLEDRGQMFIADGEDVYEGMIIGENSRGEDLDVNPLKGKKLTNVRASGKDESIRLTPAAPSHARTSHGVDRRRRAGGSHPRRDTPAQSLSRSKRAQETGSARRKRVNPQPAHRHVDAAAPFRAPLFAIRRANIYRLLGQV